MQGNFYEYEALELQERDTYRCSVDATQGRLFAVETSTSELKQWGRRSIRCCRSALYPSVNRTSLFIPKSIMIFD